MSTYFRPGSIGFRLPVAVLIVFIAGALSAESLLIKVSESLRQYYLRQANVWQKTEIPQMNISAGPETNIAVAAEQEVSCQYLLNSDLAGHAPKFQCKLAGSNEIVLVKYKSRETFAEIAASRLLWALGFYADANYPVKLNCLGCPGKEGEHANKVFDDAIIERNFPAEIGERRNQGWTWTEFEEVKDHPGAAGIAQVDALKLLAVFIQHTDNKSEQQRLGCFSEDIQRSEHSITCKKPLAMIQDLGATFGKGGPEVTSDSSMTYASWKSVSIWNKQKEDEFARENEGERACFGTLTDAKFVRNGLSDPKISEAGRKFLSDLLNQLSDQQIHDLFRVARVDRIGEMVEHESAKKRVTIEDWVTLFKEKRRQINERICS